MIQITHAPGFFARLRLTFTSRVVASRRRVGLNVRKFRSARGLSQEELAFECGLHRTYVSGVERGVRNPTVVVLEKIAKALKVATSLLLD